MALPAQAFALRSPNDLPPGALFQSRGSWALRVVWAKATQGYLLLEKDRAGQLFTLRPGMASAMAVVAPFGWFPAVEAASSFTSGASFTLALTVMAEGLVIAGCDLEESSFDPEYQGFKPDGTWVSEYSHYGSAHRCTEWSAELCHIDRPLYSLGKVLTVKVNAADERHQGRCP